MMTALAMGRSTIAQGKVGVGPAGRDSRGAARMALNAAIRTAVTGGGARGASALTATGCLGLLTKLEFLQQRAAQDLSDFETIAVFLRKLCIRLLAPGEVLITALVRFSASRQSFRDDDQV